jgi:uracil-DNA glycosylase
VTLFPGPSLTELRDAVQSCTACDLYKEATQAVFGEGPPDAKLMLIGEVPGDKEDLAGHPFVGPAGKVLDDALEAVGIARDEIYVTNAVKHFKFEMRGKRRIHQTPRANEIAACRPWLEAEVAAIHPEILICLGATAARVIFGDSFRITKDRGRFAPTRWAPKTIATYHPSAVLRGQDEAEQARLYAMLVEDLRKVADA